jgi:hypothetical protein
MTEEIDANESEIIEVEAEAETDKTEDDTKGEAEDEEEHKRKTGVERRIAELTREKYEFRAREREKDLIIAQQKELIEGKPNADDEQPVDIQKIRNEAVREAAFTIKCNAVHEKGVETIPEFLESLDKLKILKMPDYVLDVIVDSAAPEQVLNYLGKNLDIAEKLESLTPYKLARKLLDIESEIVKEKKQSKVSAPIKPISARSGGSKSVTEMSDEEYAKWRKKAN